MDEKVESVYQGCKNAKDLYVNVRASDLVKIIEYLRNGQLSSQEQDVDG